MKSTSQLKIDYEFLVSPFGGILIASTSQGICYLGFSEDIQVADLTRRFPHSIFRFKTKKIHQNTLDIYLNKTSINKVDFHLKGTPFQLAVWGKLLSIPLSQTSTYGAIAELINKPKAFRAVGTAIGNNPISLLIPCHRVLQSSGGLGGYMWGTERKKEILSFEKKKYCHSKKSTIRII